ncbi:DUF4232 domain-containing protein [Streptomyces sp. NPDC001165]|uniref:DUF4232 domain-containing protein n=1 Tax=Streptomyces sp. NPDC001165 TaxID=3364546 RepID=UPI0036CD58E6
MSDPAAASLAGRDPAGRNAGPAMSGKPVWAASGRDTTVKLLGRVWYNRCRTCGVMSVTRPMSHPRSRRATALSAPLILRRVLPATALACIAVIATGCSAGSAGPSSGGTAATAVSDAPATSGAPATTGAPATSGAPATTAPAAAATARASGTGTGTATPTSTTHGGTAACPTRYLNARPGVSQGAAGSVYQVIDFTNISKTACTLYGYPGVSLAGGSPVRQIGPAATRNTTTPPTLVTLAPGATGNALLRITNAGNYPAEQCHPTAAQYLQVYPPGQTTPIYVAYNSTACAGTVGILSVSTVQPGAGSAS